MFKLVVTYREPGRPQRQQSYNADNIEAALARKVLELAKPSVRHIELTMIVSTWSKVETDRDPR
jgi:hypothetical protein